MDMFPNPAATNKEYIVPLVCEHLEILVKKFSCIFSYPLTAMPAWKKTFHCLRKEEEMTDIRNDHSLKSKHMGMTLDTFRIQIEDVYPRIAKRDLVILLLFSTSTYGSWEPPHPRTQKVREGKDYKQLKKTCKCACLISFLI